VGAPPPIALRNCWWFMSAFLQIFAVSCSVLRATASSDDGVGGYAGLLQTSSSLRLGDASALRAAYSRPQSLRDWEPPAECGLDHKEDLYRPVKEVLSEHPGMDGMCYFSFAAFWINAFPTDPAVQRQIDFAKAGRSGVGGLQNLPLTCGFGGFEAHKGKGRSWTYKGDWGSVTSSSQDCFFYKQDDIYCYTLGWLRNQRLDSSKISNSTAWLELGGQECEAMQTKYNFTDEETTVGFCVDQNSGPMLLHILAGTVTSRELARHVYPKCLMSGPIAFASEMAYCQALGCVLPGNRIGHAEECD